MKVKGYPPLFILLILAGIPPLAVIGMLMLTGTPWEWVFPLIWAASMVGTFYFTEKR